MKVIDLCCSINPHIYCANCKWKICQDCADDLYPRGTKSKKKDLNRHHNDRSLCIIPDIWFYSHDN